MVDELVSVEEAGRRLGGISRWTIYSWFATGKLQKTRVGERRVMVRQSELDRITRDEAPRPRPTKPSQEGAL